MLAEAPPAHVYERLTDGLVTRDLAEAKKRLQTPGA
jgi:hypothetical protein